MLSTQRNLLKGLFLFSFCATTIPLAQAADREIGGYVDKAESRFVRNFDRACRTDNTVVVTTFGNGVDV